MKILSFFSGGGFMDLGFEEAGFDIIWTNEFDVDFAELHNAGINSYRASKNKHFKKSIINTNSINDISTKTILEEAFPDGEIDEFGVIGGPPCQDFSINGKKIGFNGDRGKLTITFFNKIHELSPSFFLMENVPNLKRNKDNWQYFNSILNPIKDEYYVDFDIVNAINFGVPQSRERLFVFGVKKDKVKGDFSDFNPFKIQFKKYAIYDNAIKQFNWPKLNEFGNNIELDKKLPKNLCVHNCLIEDEKIKDVPNANEYFPFRVSKTKLNKIMEGETNRPSFKRLHRNRYSPTTCYGNNEVHLHPYKNRRISVREALNIQGVPISYVLPENVSKTKKFKLIGNGVPVPLAKGIALSIKDFIVSEKLPHKNMG